MSETLYQALSQLNLQPGQRERMHVNGYDVEIRRIPEDESEFANMVMLQPWVSFPDSPAVRNIPVHHAPHPLPVPPDIPADEDGRA
jgi:hypothetical protein